MLRMLTAVALLLSFSTAVAAQDAKAVVAAAHYGAFLCFCPVCEHVWDCDAVSFNPIS